MIDPVETFGKMKVDTNSVVVETKEDILLYINGKQGKIRGMIFAKAY